MILDHQSPTKVDDLVKSIMRGGSTLLHDLFPEQKTKSPHILWSPRQSDLNNPLIADFAKTCMSMTKTNQPLQQADFNFAKFDAHLPWLMVLDVENDGAAFRYSHYGEGIAKVRGLSMLGKTSDDFGGHIGLFFSAAYRAVLHRKEWLQTEHTPPKEIFARNWERLIVPVVAANGAVTKFIVMNVPDNELRAGLEIIPDPVMLLDADQVVRFANSAARRMFDSSQFPTEDQTLFEYSGMDLNIAQSPTELLRKRAVYDKVCLSMRNSLLQDILVTISAARLWDHDFYVLTLRMENPTG